MNIMMITTNFQQWKKLAKIAARERFKIEMVQQFANGG